VFLFFIERQQLFALFVEISQKGFRLLSSFNGPKILKQTCFLFFPEKRENVAM
jgi:hypothetical protein